MKLSTAFLALLAGSAPAWAAKPCEQLKTEIAAQIDANHVSSYTLQIVANDQVEGRTVVGSCDGGTRKIVYENHAPVTAAPPPPDKTAKAGDEKKK